MSNLDSPAAAPEMGKAEREANAASVSALNGMLKCKKNMKKKNKMQEQQESSPDFGSTAVADAEEQGEAKGMGMGEREATNAAASALNGTLKCKKKMKKKNKMQEQQDPLPNLDSMETAEAEEQGEAKGRGMEELEATDAAVSALNGAPKCKKKKMEKKNNTHEEQESLPVLDSTAAPEAEEQGEAKGRGMEEREATNALASVSLNGTPKCKKKKMKKKNKIQEQHESPPDLDSMAAAEAQEQGEAKEGGMEKPEATNAAALTLVGTPKCKKEEEAKMKDSVMLDKEATTTVCSASQGTPKRRKRKRKDKMQEQLESQQASPVIAGVDKIMSNESENGCTDGLYASGHADVSMDPINGEDPSCALSNAKDTEVLVETCSKNLQESSAGRKRRKRKRKRGSSSSGPGFSCESGGIVAEHSLDPSTLHDLSCICISCKAHKENIKNIYSPRGSLVRFQRKKLLILDLNGLLADINQDFHSAHKAHGRVRDKLVFKRPFYDDFLRFCFQNFEIGIWSSRKRENVSSVVNILMKELKKYLLFCWDMSYCTVTGCNTIDNKHKPLVLKELKKLWNKEDPNLPWEQGEFSPSNTLLVDDSPYKALVNPPNTAIFPQPYSYRNERDDYSLGPGGDLRIYLERIAAADNVQNFVQDNPFGQHSITESDPNWNFYVQIVEKVEKQIVNKIENQIVDKVEKQIIDKAENEIVDKVAQQIVDKVERSLA